MEHFQMAPRRKLRSMLNYTSLRPIYQCSNTIPFLTNPRRAVRLFNRGCFVDSLVPGGR